MTKIFIAKKGNVLPKFSKDGTYYHYNVSDRYLAKIITLGGDVVFNTVMYDFKHNKWKSSSSGLKEVIEYYVEDENFEKWIKNINKIDLTTLFEIYSSMDKHDNE